MTETEVLPAIAAALNRIAVAHAVHYRHRPARGAGRSSPPGSRRSKLIIQT
jgi:hypothetical protein